MSGRDRLYSNGREECRPPGFPVTSPIPIPSGQSHKSPAHARSTASTGSGSYSDDGSLPSSISTAPSMTPFDYGYEFCCEFGFVGCDLTFHPSSIDSYLAHTTSHFVKHRPPRRTCCIFCDRVYEASNDHRESNWRQRGRHIAGHFRNGSLPQHMKPDFFVMEYMWKKGLMSDEDYQWAIRGTERPLCDGLVDVGYKPPEMRAKDSRSSQQPYDQAKEDRGRRRKKDSKGKGKEKSR